MYKEFRFTREHYCVKLVKISREWPEINLKFL